MDLVLPPSTQENKEGMVLWSSPGLRKERKGSQDLGTGVTQVSESSKSHWLMGGIEMQGRLFGYKKL